MAYVIEPPRPVAVPVLGDGLFPVRRVYCVGRNYAAHAREMGADPTREAPFFFCKPADAVVPAHAGRIVDLPYPLATSNLHYEVELVVAIGRAGRDIAVADALQGMDDGELFLEHRQSEGLSFDNGRLKQATYDTAQGFGLRAVKDDGTAATASTPIELVQGTHDKFKSNNWPKFAPFYQAGRYGFVIYSATYGLGFETGGTPQMYMFGVDMEKAKAGADPSYQPVYLPFQDRTTNNHSAIWTTDIRCQDDTDCPSDYKCMMSSCTSMM